MLTRNRHVHRLIRTSVFLLLCGSFRALTASGEPGAALVGSLEAIGGQPNRGASTDWRSVRESSFLFLSVQHASRIAFQQKTREYLGGPFLSNYGESVKGLHGWGDGDGIFTNYVMHPMQGASTGFFYVQANPDAEAQQFGRSGAYWKSRLRAMGISAFYSTQFELGPISEASIGNVGMKKGTMGFVDLIITPVGGFGWIVAEDAVDRFLIEKLERKWPRPGLIRFFRVALNPTRSVANVMRFRLPWYRPGRQLNRLFQSPEAAQDQFNAWLMLTASGGSCTEADAPSFRPGDYEANLAGTSLSSFGTAAAAAR